MTAWCDEGGVKRRERERGEEVDLITTMCEGGVERRERGEEGDQGYEKGERVWV